MDTMEYRTTEGFHAICVLPRPPIGERVGTVPGLDWNSLGPLQDESDILLER